MKSNLDRYKSDLNKLAERGQLLLSAMRLDCYPEQVKAAYEKQLGDKAEKYLKDLPKFADEYQGWYSEAQALIRQMLPDRLEDFHRHYLKPKPRKDITFENYRIEDYLQGLRVTRGHDWQKETVVDGSAAIPHFQQQLAILSAASLRFESTLFDIRQLVQADLFDSELDAARELLKKGFLRGAGAIAGVVLERHLGEICQNHKITSLKKHPTISEFNDLLKNGSVIDVPSWRQIQRLGDLRNLCDHGKDRDPTGDEVEELISGTERYTHNLY